MGKNITIIGSGISGLSIADMLSPRYETEVLEKAASAGGLIKCDRVDGHLFHRVGGHVFNSKNTAVLEWFWKHFDREKEFQEAKRNAKIWMGGRLIGYPLENYLYQLPQEQTALIIHDLLTLIRERPQKQPGAYHDFKEFLINTFGRQLYDLYFGPYNSKIWNTDISKVPLEWLDGKLPMPRLEDILINNVIRKEEQNMVHATFFYPRVNGSQFIINRLAEHKRLVLSYPVTRIEKQGNELVINGEKRSAAVVYTGDCRQLHHMIDIDDPDLRSALLALKDLQSNGTSNVLCETDPSDLSWLYLPEARFKAHRIIYTGNFSQSNNSGTGSRRTCVVEFSGKQDQETMTRELKDLPGNLRPIAFNHEPNSYIIHQQDTSKKIATAKELLRKYRVFLLGRFAEWEYYNMDKCIESAMGLDLQLDQMLAG